MASSIVGPDHPALFRSLERGADVDAPQRRLVTSRTTQRFDTILFWAFIAGLAWSPFWIGGHDLLAWGINAVIFPGLALTYEASLLIRGKHHPVAIRHLGLPAILFLAVVVWILVQNATWTPESWHHPIWGIAAETLERPVQGSISVNRDLTFLALLRLLTAASVFWIAVQLCRDEMRADLMIKAVAAIVCAYALYGLIAYSLTPGYVLWLENRFASGNVTSTFFNRNSFATYAGIGLVAMCGLLLRFYRQETHISGGSLQFRIASIIEASGRRGLFLLGGTLIIFVALMLTGSRGGISATLLGLFVLGVLTFGRRGSSNQRTAIIIGVALVAAALHVYGERFISRVTADGLYDENRMAIYIITLRSILDSPLLGYGYGTFSDVFPMFRDQSVSVTGRWEMAHNTYVEVFQGLGLAFGTMLVWAVAILTFRCLTAATTRRRGVTVAAVAASAAILVGVHALVDFSLQIQGVAITFMAVLGAGVAQSESSRRALND